MSKVPLIVGLQKVIQAIKQWLPFTPGDGTSSIVQDGNQAFATNGTAFGYNTIVGSKGYRISDFMADGERIDKNTYPTGTYTLALNEGETIPTEIVNSVLYSMYLKQTKDNIGKITSIDGNVITVQPFFYPEKWDEGQWEELDENGNKTGNTLTGEAWEEAKAEAFASSYIIFEGLPTIGNVNVGTGAHAEGWGNIATQLGSHAEGCNSKALGKYSHAEGERTVAYYSAHSEGKYSKATGYHSHAEGYQTEAQGMDSHSEGRQTKAIGQDAHAEGQLTTAEGQYSHSEGQNTLASGVSAHAEGGSSQATGARSHAEGQGTLASGANAHAEGNETKAIGSNSHAEGQGSIAYGLYSHAGGYDSTTGVLKEDGTVEANSGSYALSYGYRTSAKGKGAVALGRDTVATDDYQTVVGSFNDPTVKNARFVVGTGTTAGNLKNGFIVYKDGHVSVGKGGTSENDLVTVSQLNSTGAQLSNIHFPQTYKVISTSSSGGWYQIAKGSNIKSVSGIFKVTAQIQSGGLWSEIIFVASKALNADGKVTIINEQSHINGAAIDNIRLRYTDNTVNSDVYVDVQCRNNNSSATDTVTISVELIDSTKADKLTGGLWNLIDIIQEPSTGWTYTKQIYAKKMLILNSDGSGEVYIPENPSDNHIANVGHVNNEILLMQKGTTWIDFGNFDYSSLSSYYGYINIIGFNKYIHTQNKSFYIKPISIKGTGTRPDFFCKYISGTFQSSYSYPKYILSKANEIIWSPKKNKKTNGTLTITGTYKLYTKSGATPITTENYSVSVEIDDQTTFVGNVRMDEISSFSVDWAPASAPIYVGNPTHDYHAVNRKMFNSQTELLDSRLSVLEGGLLTYTTMELLPIKDTFLFENPNVGSFILEEIYCCTTADKNARPVPYGLRCSSGMLFNLGVETAYEIQDWLRENTEEGCLEMRLSINEDGQIVISYLNRDTDSIEYSHTFRDYIVDKPIITNKYPDMELYCLGKDSVMSDLSLKIGCAKFKQGELTND